MQVHDLPSDPAPARVWLSANEVGDLVGVSHCTIRDLTNRGRFPRPVRLGRAMRWHRPTIEAWLAAGAPADWDFSQPAIVAGGAR